MARVHKITIKLSSEEREEINVLLRTKKINISDCIRLALKEFYSLENFEPSYEITANKQYEKKRKWELY